jgi:hypothetical protein
MKISYHPVASLLGFIFFSLAFSPLSAQETANSSDTVEPKLIPIEINYHSLEGLQYSLQGVPLTRYPEFEALVFPLRDWEATRLLKSSETSDSNSKIFDAIGFAGLVTGVVGLLTSPSNHQPPFWITAIGGGVLIDIGGIFQMEAQGAKFNCAQRYNRFARGEEQILPKGPENEKSLLNFDSSKTLPSSPAPKP